MQTSAGRFSANSFQYNGRVALAFIPSLFVLAAVAGGFVVGTMMVSFEDLNNMVFFCCVWKGRVMGCWCQYQLF